MPDSTEPKLRGLWFAPALGALIVASLLLLGIAALVAIPVAILLATVLYGLLRKRPPKDPGLPKA